MNIYIKSRNLIINTDHMTTASYNDTVGEVRIWMGEDEDGGVCDVCISEPEASALWDILTATCHFTIPDEDDLQTDDLRDDATSQRPF